MNFSGRQSRVAAGRGVLWESPHTAGTCPQPRLPRGLESGSVSAALRGAVLLAGSGCAGAVGSVLTQHRAADTGTTNSISAELLRAGLAGKRGFHSSK